MSSKKKGPRLLSIGASIHDAAYEARQRRAAWHGLYFAVSRFLEAASKEQRMRAEDEMLRLHTRLEKLGVRMGHGVDAGTPEPEGADAAL